MTELQAVHPGTLYVVATPIGNLDDLGARAQQVLAGVDFILAEDTRHSLRLLNRYGIRRPLRALHEHNERRAAGGVVRRLQGGDSAALVADAGTPLISDPGDILVRAAQEAGVPVAAVPGPCAVSAALSVAGLAAHRFCFEGFLPPRRAARLARMQALRREPRTMVLFEAPQRLRGFLQDAASCFGEQRPAAAVKEISKLHERARLAPLGKLRDETQAAEETQGRRVKGEFVVVVAGETAPSPPGRDEAERVLRLLLERLPRREAVSLAAALTGWGRNPLYRLCLSWKTGRDGQ